MMLKKVLTATVGVSLFCFSALTLAGDAEKGKAVYQNKGCAACHGPTGQSVNPAQFPALTGKDSNYIAEQLKAFKNDERQGQGPGIIMNQVTKTLSESEIEDLAAFVESL
jgi:cytochrome c553